MRRTVVVNDKMQRGYTYDRTQPVGRNFAPEFEPQLTPKQMLRLGIFGGKYMTDCQEEFPRSWFARARLCAERHDARLNCFGVNASQSLAVWRRSGWIHKQDHVGGSSGIAATTWAGEPPTMPGRFDAGVRSPDTWRRFGSTANRAISNVGGASGRPSFTGHTTAERYRKGVTCECS